MAAGLQLTMKAGRGRLVELPFVWCSVLPEWAVQPPACRGTGTPRSLGALSATNLTEERMHSGQWLLLIRLASGAHSHMRSVLCGPVFQQGLIVRPRDKPHTSHVNCHIREGHPKRDGALVWH